MLATQGPQVPHVFGQPVDWVFHDPISRRVSWHGPRPPVRFCGRVRERVRSLISLISPQTPRRFPNSAHGRIARSGTPGLRSGCPRERPLHLGKEPSFFYAVADDLEVEAKSWVETPKDSW